MSGERSSHQRRKRVPGSVLALVILTAGLAAPTPGALAGHQSEPYFDLSVLPPTDYSGKQIFDGLKQFVADYPLRITGTPNEVRAAVALRDEMAGLGYDSQICSVNTNTDAICDETSPGVGLKAVMAIKPGTTRPNEWIAFIGHYDSIASTIDGAYDNGAGTNFIRYLAHEFKNVPTNRSLAFIWYNAEEEGLLASQRHAQYLKNTGQQITAVLGFDMVGIAFPVATTTARNCMCMFHGADDGAAAVPLLSHVNYDFLGFPGAGQPTSRQARLVGPNTRNSDESRFESQGFFTLRWAGMRTAGDYVAYHEPEDTIATIISEAGGETYYEQGIENTLKSVYYTALALDNHLPSPAATLTTEGFSLDADASSSSDADAPPTVFEWDFGDGATTQGLSVQHRYASPGTYQVTLTVRDNLWSAASSTATFPVTVA